MSPSGAPRCAQAPAVAAARAPHREEEALFLVVALGPPPGPPGVATKGRRGWSRTRQEQSSERGKGGRIQSNPIQAGARAGRELREGKPFRPNPVGSDRRVAAREGTRRGLGRVCLLPCDSALAVGGGGGRGGGVAGGGARRCGSSRTPSRPSRPTSSTPMRCEFLPPVDCLCWC